MQKTVRCNISSCVISPGQRATTRASEFLIRRKREIELTRALAVRRCFQMKTTMIRCFDRWSNVELASSIENFWPTASTCCADSTSLELQIRHGNLGQLTLGCMLATARRTMSVRCLGDLLSRRTTFDIDRAMLRWSLCEDVLQVQTSGGRKCLCSRRSDASLSDIGVPNLARTKTLSVLGTICRSGRQTVLAAYVIAMLAGGLANRTIASARPTGLNEAFALPDEQCDTRTQSHTADANTLRS